jgi:hypothetical protein
MKFESNNTRTHLVQTAAEAVWPSVPARELQLSRPLNHLLTEGPIMLPSRNRLGFVLIVLVLVSGLILSPGLARENKGKKYALLVAELKFTEADVEELAKILKRPEAGFFSLRVLPTSRGKKNSADAPTAENIRKAIDALVENKSKHDLILVAFSGHGIQLEVRDPKGEKPEKPMATSARWTPGSPG